MTALVAISSGLRRTRCSQVAGERREGKRDRDGEEDAAGLAALLPVSDLAQMPRVR